MGFFYLFTSILGESVGKTFDKLNFKRTRIGVRLSLLLTFFIMSLTVGGYVALFGQPLPQLSMAVLTLLSLIGVFSFGGNVFDILSVKADDISLREPLVDFEPIMAGLIGYLLFPAERKLSFLLAFLAGTLVVHWGIHRRKLRNYQRKGMRYLWIAVVLYAVLPSLFQEALKYVTPEYIALFRLVSVTILTALFFRPKKILRSLTGKRIMYGTLAGIAYGIGAVVSIYAIQVYGVVITMLFLMLGPAMRYLSSYFILHEKVRRGEVISSLMLTLIVALAAFTQ